MFRFFSILLVSTAQEPRTCPEDFVTKDDFEKQWEQIQNIESPLKALYVDCDDLYYDCVDWAKGGYCEENPIYMSVNCRLSCGECNEIDVYMGEKQIIGDEKDHGLETLELYKQSILYKKNEIVAKPDEHNINVQYNCLNHHESCTWWALTGECENNPDFMNINCGPSCRSCHLIDILNRCPLDPSAKNAIAANDLDKIFLEIIDVNGPYKKYEPIVHSHPLDVVNPNSIQYGEDPVTDGPWVVSFESFHTDKEADRLMKWGKQIGYERSENVRDELPDGTLEDYTDDTRTSFNTWCTEKCENDHHVQNIIKRIVSVTGIDSINYESMQLLKYTKGQYYKKHHDFIQAHVERQSGPRVLTFFLYLNNVEKGGATNFPFLKESKGGLKFYPKKGRALLWPSVQNGDPNNIDLRTEHEAMEVIDGEKYGANVWIHLRDFKTPSSNGCV